MKTLLLLFAALLWGQTSHAQVIPDEQVPPLPFVALQQLYPQARNVKWRRAQGWYQASYSQNQARWLVRFDTNGDVQATGHNITLPTLPLPVRLALATRFPTRIICQADQITNAHTKELTYEMATCESYVSSTIVLTSGGLKVPRVRNR